MRGLPSHHADGCASNDEVYFTINHRHFQVFVAHWPPMKTLSAVGLSFALLFCSLCQGAEYVNLITPPSVGPVLAYSQTITLEAGDLAEVIYSPNGGELEYQIGTNTFKVTLVPPNQNPQPKIAGPATLRMVLALPAGSSVPTANLTLFAITRANTAANVIPANAVVIPEDAGGQYQVILESSTDLLNWAVTNPGTYGGNTPGRFFRTRIVKLN